MAETQYEALRRQGVSRRSFLQFCSLTAASLGLGSARRQGYRYRDADQTPRSGGLASRS